MTTAGGPLIQDFGYAYVRSVMVDCFGIKDSELIKAEMLDIYSADPERIVNETIESIKTDEEIC